MHAEISTNLESNASASKRATGKGISNQILASKRDTSQTQEIS